MSEPRRPRPFGWILVVLSACLLAAARGASAQVAPPSLQLQGFYPTTTAIGFTWAPVSGATGYVLQCATNAQFTGAIQVGPLSASSYVFNNLASGTTYYCRGSSVAPAPSGWSSPFSVTTGTVPPTPNPTTVAAMGAMQTQVAAAAADQQTAYNIVQSIITGIQTTAGKTTCGGVAATTLTAGQYLASGQQIFSPNGKYRLRYQPDANFVLYLGTSTTVLWATNKYLGNPGKALMQSDGNLVTYNGSGAATWATGTYGRTGVWLALQDDGNLVLYQGACTPIWHR